MAVLGYRGSGDIDRLTTILSEDLNMNLMHDCQIKYLKKKKSFPLE